VSEDADLNRARKAIEEASANAKPGMARDLLDELQNETIPSLENGLGLIQAIRSSRELTVEEKRREREFTDALNELKTWELELWWDASA
jgi:hypothetical protein